MSNNYIHIGTLNDHSQDHSKHVTINAPGADISSLVRSIFAEDVTPSEDSSFASDNLSDSPSSPASDKRPKNTLFCRITQAAYEKGVAQQVDDDLRSACVSAPKLVKALNTNDALGYTDTKNLPSTKLYKLLEEHYGLTFDVRAFQIARSK